MATPAADKPKRCTSALFREVAADWLTLIAPTLSDSTLSEYRRILNRYFLHYLGSRPIDTIGYEEFSLYMARLPLKTGKTFNNVMIPARGIFGYAARTNKAKQDITIHIPWRKHQAPGPDPLDLRQVKMILGRLRAIHHQAWLNYFEFAVFSGIRPSEQIAIRWPAVDWQRQQVCISAARVKAYDQGTKTHKIRFVDLQTPALAALRRQFELTNSCSGHIFLNPRTSKRLPDPSAALAVWHDTLKAAGIRDRGAKQTRHTYATLCLHAGMNPAYVSRQMGHANAKMFFEVYARWIDGSANAREKAKMDALLNTEFTTA